MLIKKRTEIESSAYLERRLTALVLKERCEFRKEVRMLCWTHTSKKQADTLRIDYVAKLDNGPLIGIEVKATPGHASDLGRALFQCAQYAAGVIGAATIERVPHEWVGKPLAAVFLYMHPDDLSDYVRKHAGPAHRLYGPANVGFLFFRKRRDFGEKMELRLCAERYWCEQHGYHNGSISNKANRSGNGSFHAE